MKGIILAGGTGSRLFPATLAVSKQLLPIYDKPLIYYPLNTLLSLGVREILLISDDTSLPSFQRLLGNGEDFGISLRYAVQNAPNGIAEALIIGETFLHNEACILILGDNIFYGSFLSETLSCVSSHFQGALSFALKVPNPQRFGVVQFDNNQVIDIIEKPKTPPSDYAIVGMYVLDGKAASLAKTLTPSSRNELEITDLQKIYLQNNQLKVCLLPDDFIWFDTGTAHSLWQACQWVYEKEQKLNKKIGAVELTAYQNGWISAEQLKKRAEKMKNSEYGQKLLKNW